MRGDRILVRVVRSVVIRGDNLPDVSVDGVYLGSPRCCWVVKFSFGCHRSDSRQTSGELPLFVNHAILVTGVWAWQRYGRESSCTDGGWWEWSGDGGCHSFLYFARSGVCFFGGTVGGSGFGVGCVLSSVACRSASPTRHTFSTLPDSRDTVCVAMYF